jgi:hypothetical protein
VSAIDSTPHVDHLDAVVEANVCHVVFEGFKVELNAPGLLAQPAAFGGTATGFASPVRTQRAMPSSQAFVSATPFAMPA